MKSIVNRSIVVAVEWIVESIGQNTSRYYIIDLYQKYIRLVCTKHCMNHNRTYICGIRRMAFNDKTVHTHVYYYLLTITRNLIPKTFDYTTLSKR